MPSRDAPIIRDSVTELGDDGRGRVVLAASHGGRYAAWCAAKAGVAAVILSDAGRGRNGAGVAGLAMLEALGVPAAAIDVFTARIGDGADCARRGVLSVVNGAAERAGLRVGMAAGDALARLSAAPLSPSPPPPPMAEARRRIAEASTDAVAVLALDSVSLMRDEDAGHIAVTGSHGGLLGGRASTAAKVPVFAALFNDAGIGIDGAGIGRLPALEERGIAAATVAASSAEIGDAMSTWRDGVVSAVNAAAARHGGAAGQPARTLVALLAAARSTGHRE